MKLKSIAIIALFLSMAFLNPALVRAEEEQGGEEAKKKEKLLTFEMDGYYRLRWSNISEMDAFPEGPVPRVRYWDQRWRLDPSLTIRPNLWLWKSVTLHAKADVWDGAFGIAHERQANLTSDEYTWDVPYLQESGDWTEHGFLMREYWAELDFTAFIIQVGRMSSHWGTGILANDGDGFRNDFGDAYFGDMVDRVIIGTKPIDLITGGRVETDIILGFTYDWLVVEDRTGGEDDNPTQFIVALMKRPEKETGEGIYHDISGGIYYVNRRQDDDTFANVVDATFRIPVFLMEDKLKLALNFEGLYIWGSTNANKSLNAPGGSDISQYGLMSSLSAETKFADLITEIGLASGDPDPFDDQIMDFHFNPDYNVGLLMFERVMAAATANTSYMFASPALSAQAPAGIDLFPTDGSVTNAFYVYPRLKLHPVKQFELIAGLLYAMAPQDLVDPYRSFLNGGVATNFNGGKADDDLGWEFDLGASVIIGKKEKAAVRIGGQWGWFWPGKAWDDADGNKMDKVEIGQFRLDVIY